MTQAVRQESRNVASRSSFMPWFYWILGASFFAIHYFARVAPSVLVTPLMQAFHADAAMFGSLSAFFYIAYIGMQLPVGLLFDRFGIRRLLLMATIACIGGCVAFAMAKNIYIAELGRFMLGFGAAFGFVGAMKIAADWFPAGRFGLLASATQALGMLGGTFGEWPMAVLSHHIGWRGAMNVVAMLFVGIGILIMFFLRENKNRSQVKQQLGIGQALKIVLRNPQTWLNGLFAGLLFAPTAVFGELWGVKFLSQTHHLTNEQSATAIGTIFLGWGALGSLMGWASDKIGRRKPALYFSAIGSLVTISAVLYLPHTSLWAIYSLLFLFGFFNSGLAINYALAAEINPAQVTGTSIAFANMASVLIGAGLQPVLGLLLDMGWAGKMLGDMRLYSGHDFRVSMLILPACLILAIIVGFFMKESYCKPAK